MSADSVQTLWAKLTSINGARWRKANLPKDAAGNPLSSRRDLSSISGGGAAARKEVLPEERWLNSVANNTREEEKSEYLSSYETERRLKSLLSSHEDFRSLDSAGASGGS
eukprot:3618141-Rhodomonas_salina.1